MTGPDDRPGVAADAADAADGADGAWPPFRLHEANRPLLAPDLDHDALERLMSMLPEDVRPHVFRYFLNWALADPEEVLEFFPEIEAEGPPGARTFPLPQPEQLQFHDPALQTQLARVLASRRLW